MPKGRLDTGLKVVIGGEISAICTQTTDTRLIGQLSARTSLIHFQAQMKNVRRVSSTGGGARKKAVVQSAISSPHSDCCSPSAVPRLLSCVCCLLSAVPHLLSPVCSPPSAVPCLLSCVCCLLSAVPVCSPPSAVCSLLYLPAIPSTVVSPHLLAGGCLAWSQGHNHFFKVGSSKNAPNVRKDILHELSSKV